MVSINEVALVERLQSGDEAAFELLYRMYVDQAVRVAFLVTRSQQTAEDVVQEAFTQVLRRSRTLRDPRSFRPWFYAILHNAARRVGRKGRGWTFLPLDLVGYALPDAALQPAGDAALDHAEIQELRDLIGRLPDKHREAIVLRYYAGLTEPEMAQALGIPEGTVKSRLHSARLLLGRWMAPLSDGAGGETVGTRA